MDIAHQSGNWESLGQVAWEAREHAIAARTKVGAAVIGENPAGDRKVFSGCNIEDLWKASSLHAERTAMAGMLAQGYRKLIAILVAADRPLFTPCGNCLDFIFQFGNEHTPIAFQPRPGADIQVFTAGELMPLYPR